MVQLINNFSLSCVESQQNAKTQLICTCDFRINESNCAESFLLRTGSWILIPYISFIAVTSILFLWYRIYFKGQSLLFPRSRERGIIRTRPHDAFHLVTVAFSLLHLVRLILLIRIAYSNSIWAEIMDDLPRQTSFAFSVLYLVGIIYSIPTLETTNHLSERFVPNKHLIDAGAIFLMVGPYIVNTPISYYIGYYADIEEIPDMSIKLFTAKYLIWVFWLTTYLLTLLYFWRKLVSLLKYHMKELQVRPRVDFMLQWKYETLQVASTNLSTVVMVFSFLGSMFIIVYMIFGVSYKTSIKSNNTTNVVYFFIWNFVEPICLQIAQFIIVYNAVRPTANNAPFGRMLSVVRRPVSTETSKSRSIRKNTDSLSRRSLSEIHTSIISNDDFRLHTYTTGYHLDKNSGLDDVLQFDLGDFFAGEIPIELEQHQNTRHRRDSNCIEISSFASTTYFSTTQSVHSKNDSLYSLQLPNSKRTSKRLSPSPNLNPDLGSGDEMETPKRNTRHSSLLVSRNISKEDVILQ